MSTTKTGIEWTDRTWNPVRGCSRVSEGCRNCYAERIAARFSRRGGPFHGFADQFQTKSKWTGRVELLPGKLDEPLRWQKPAMVFVNSMSDLFHESLPDEDIRIVLSVAASAAVLHGHSFQILTKRAKRMRDIVSNLEWFAGVFAVSGQKRVGPLTKICYPKGDARSEGLHRSRFQVPRGLWFGVSTESQRYADERIPHLLQTPAAVRFVSYEPALGAVDFRKHLNGLDWVIAGGESGQGARPAHPDWFRSVRDQCAAAGVPFFFKQWGEWLPALQSGAPGVCQALNASDEATRIGKKSAGRLLDCREHSEFPTEAR